MTNTEIRRPLLVRAGERVVAWDHGPGTESFPVDWTICDRPQRGACRAPSDRPWILDPAAGAGGRHTVWNPWQDRAGDVRMHVVIAVPVDTGRYPARCPRCGLPAFVSQHVYHSPNDQEKCP